MTQEWTEIENRILSEMWLNATNEKTREVNREYVEETMKQLFYAQRKSLLEEIEGIIKKQLEMTVMFYDKAEQDGRIVDWVQVLNAFIKDQLNHDVISKITNMNERTV